MPTADVDALVAALVDSGMLDAKPCHDCAAGAYHENCYDFSDGRFLGVSCGPSGDVVIDGFTTLRFRRDARVVELVTNGRDAYRGVGRLRAQIERAVAEDCH